MKNEKESKAESKAKDIAKKSKRDEEEVVPDFPPPDKAESGVASKIEHVTPAGEIDPRDDVISPEMKNKDEASARASAEYVPPDQPLDEQPPNKGRSERHRRREDKPQAPKPNERKSSAK